MVPCRSAKRRRVHLSAYRHVVCRAIANYPCAARLGKAGITSAVWSYGVGNGSGAIWGANDFLGFSQVGNTLTIARCTSGFSSTDQAAPVDQITYTRVP